MKPEIADNDLIVDDKNREFYKKLGAAIRKNRIERDMSVDELANIANVTPAQIQNYEDGIRAIPVFNLIPILQHMNFPADFDNLV